MRYPVISSCEDPGIRGIEELVPQGLRSQTLWGTLGNKFFEVFIGDLWRAKSSTFTFFFQIEFGGHLISWVCLNRTPIANPAMRIQNNAKVMTNLTTANFFLQIPLLGSLQRTILMKVCIHIQARPPKKAKRAPIQWIYWINLSPWVGVSSW